MEKPLFIAEMAQDWGKAMSVYPGEGPCYRCVFQKPEPDDNASEGNGYSVSLGGLMGLIQAVLLWNGFRMEFQQKPVERDRACPLCGEHPTITRLMRDGDSYEHIG
jgi:molybdopterin/thiamine biosynthesis adenylyltransferase